jgi:hypothetical protein
MTCGAVSARLCAEAVEEKGTAMAEMEAGLRAELSAAKLRSLEAGAYTRPPLTST